MHTTWSEHAGTLGCAAAIGRSNNCVVQQQFSKAVPIHQTSANVCSKALKGFTRLGPKHRELNPSLNTCCNTLLIPHHSAAWFETGKPLKIPDPGQHAHVVHRHQRQQQASVCMLGPSLNKMQHLLTCKLSQQRQVTPQRLSQDGPGILCYVFRAILATVLVTAS